MKIKRFGKRVVIDFVNEATALDFENNLRRVWAEKVRRVMGQKKAERKMWAQRREKQ